MLIFAALLGWFQLWVARLEYRKRVFILLPFLLALQVLALPMGYSPAAGVQSIALAALLLVSFYYGPSAASFRRYSLL